MLPLPGGPTEDRSASTINSTQHREVSRMPVPTFVTVRAERVKESDDLLVNVITKENDQSGEPHPISVVEVKEKWVYVKLREPIGRKRVWKCEYGQDVHVVRMVKTEEDVRNDMANRIADESLRNQKSYWQVRNRMADELASGIKVVERYRSLYYMPRRTAINTVGRASDVESHVTDMRRMEVSVDKWSRVESLVVSGGLDHADALARVIEETKDDIIGGRMSGVHQIEKELSALRGFIRKYERWSDVESRMERMAS